MPRKKSQTKRGGKSKNNKSRKKSLTNLLNIFTLHSNAIIMNNKYMNSNTLSMIGIILIFILLPCLVPNQYLLRLNPITYIFPSSFMGITNDNNHHNIILETHKSGNNVHHNNHNNHNNNQFCRIQSSPAPNFQRQLETENRGYIQFEGCRIVTNEDEKVEIMSNEEKDINEIMAQLHSNVAGHGNSFADSILTNHLNHNNAPTKPKKKKVSRSHTKKDKKKHKKKKKTKTKKTVLPVDEDTDKLREMDENNEFGITEEHVWQPRRDHRMEVKPHMYVHTQQPPVYVEEEFDIHDSDIDDNLMAMYKRGFELQLNKMHYASDTAYEQIMEDISTNGISQSHIYHKYHINFIPDESSFKLISPPSLYFTNKNTHNIGADSYTSSDNSHENIKNKAFKNFYGLTRMQQKYIQRNDDNRRQDDVQEDTTTDIPLTDDDMGMNMDVDMDILRDIFGHAPQDILNVILNDDKLPQWLYEGDTILDINCGIGDALIYLLQNFTTIRGICMTGTSMVKYRYAQLNIARAGLSERIEIFNVDLYAPLVRALYNRSDIIYMDFSESGDEEYLLYFIDDVMNDHDIRTAKPGRVILSYDKLLFDADIFQASYTLHFACGWQLENVSQALLNDASMYMYSIPFYLSKLSNLYVQNYQVFYGYHMHPIFEGFQHNNSDLEMVQKVNLTKIHEYKHQCTNNEPAITHTHTKPRENEQYNLNDFIQLNNENEETIFEIITSGISMNVNEFDEIDEIQNIWTMISSQLLYQSFISGIQQIIQRDVDNENSQILLNILNAINERFISDDNMGNEWQYLEDTIFNVHRIDSCYLYKYIFEQWQSELNDLLKEFKSLFFYESVKDSTDLKMQSLLQKCNT